MTGRILIVWDFTAYPEIQPNEPVLELRWTIMRLNQIAVVWLIAIVDQLDNVLGAEKANVDGEVSIDKMTNSNNKDDYLLSPHSSSDDKIQNERGRLKTSLEGREEPTWFVTGRFGYKLIDGKLIAFKYTADDERFRQHEPDEPEVIVHVGAVGNRIDLKALESLIG